VGREAQSIYVMYISTLVTFLKPTGTTFSPKQFVIVYGYIKVTKGYRNVQGRGKAKNHYLGIDPGFFPIALFPKQ